MSVDVRLPMPSTWASRAVCAATREQAWGEFSGVLKDIGFQNVCYVDEVPRFRLQFPETERVLGFMVSPEFEAQARANPDSQTGYSVAPACSTDEALSLDPLHDIQQAQTQETRGALSLLLEHGFRGGWTFPVSDRRKGTFSVLMIDCHIDREDHQALIEEHQPYLKASVIYFREGLEVRRLLAQSDGPLLSRRESDCLAWTAAGRSAKETASLMGIAASTANEYIANATAKLDATNRTQAASRAMLAGCLGYQQQ